MKKIVPAIALAFVLLLIVIGCKAQGEHQADVPPEETVKVEETQPAETETPEPEESNEPVNQVEKMSVNTQQETDTRRLATEEELLKVFNDTYEFGKSFANTGFSEEDVLEQELNQLNFIMGMMADFRAPDDLEVQYLTWRLLNHSQEPATQAPASNTQQVPNTTTTTTTQTGTPASTGDSGTAQLTNGDLAVDVTGGMNPNDFHMNGYDEDNKSIDGRGYLDMSKVGFGE